ncbi:bilin-binding protein-like [Eurosta solidaginis]|uniref:bilin-binding protein-like n=1 Tax=Eurosta solidaginis TaxID=178769 RepID=UPI0035307292
MLKYKFAIAPLSILIFLTTSCLVAGQIQRDGCCRRDINFVPNDDLSAFVGSWYMHSRYRIVIDENARCYKTEYTLDSNNVHRVKNFQISNADGCGTLKTGTITPSDDNYIIVKFDDPQAHHYYYKILTFCDDFVIIYLCREIPFTRKHNEFVWVHTKVRNPDQSVQDAYISALNDQQLSTELELVSQDDCGNYDA